MNVTTAPVTAQQHVTKGQAVLPAGPGAPQLSFGGIVKSEWIKLTSLRSIRITLLLTVLAGWGLAGLISLSWGFDISNAPASELGSFILMTSAFSAPFLALIFGVLGVFAMSSEYSSGMILSTLAAVPKRTPVFFAKALVVSLIATATAIVTIIGSVLISIITVPAAAGALFSANVMTGLLGATAYLLLVAIFAFGIAGITRSTAGGIAIVAGVTFVLPIGFQVLSLSGWEWVPVAASYLPTPLGSTLGQGFTAGSEHFNFEHPAYLLALIAMFVWAAVPTLVAAGLFRRRDAK